MIVRFLRANEETQRESEPRDDAWKKKGGKANNNVPMTTNASAWLKLNAEKQHTQVIKDWATAAIGAPLHVVSTT